MVKSYSFEHQPEAVFNLIVAESLKAFNRPNLERDKIKGYVHKSKIKNQMGQDVSVSQEVTEFVENTIYEVTTSSKKDRYVTIYRLFPKNNKTVMEYEEKYYGSSLLRNINHMVMSLVYRRKIKKRVLAIFTGINHVLNDTN